MVSKSERRENAPEEQIKVDAQVAPVKDLVTENIEVLLYVFVLQHIIFSKLEINLQLLVFMWSLSR